MRSKISRNDDKVPNKQRNENALDNSISILLKGKAKLFRVTVHRKFSNDGRSLRFVSHEI